MLNYMCLFIKERLKNEEQQQGVSCDVSQDRKSFNFTYITNYDIVMYKKRS